MDNIIKTSTKDSSNVAMTTHTAIKENELKHCQQSKYSIHQGAGVGHQQLLGLHGQDGHKELRGGVTTPTNN